MAVFDVTSVLKKRVRLTEAQWEHIRGRHPEMAGQQNKMLRTLVQPDFVVYSAADETHHYCRAYTGTPVSDKLLLLVVKHLNGDGFVVTAFFVNRIRKQGKVIVYGQETYDQL